MVSNLTSKSMSHKSGAHSFRSMSMIYFFYTDKVENLLHYFVKGNLWIFSCFFVLIDQSEPCLTIECTALIEGRLIGTMYRNYHHSVLTLYLLYLPGLPPKILQSSGSGVCMSYTDLCMSSQV